MSRRAAVFGASGGIGAALAAQLCADPAFGEVWLGARASPVSPPLASPASSVRPFAFDFADEASLAAAAAQIGAGGKVDLVLVATGQLQGPGGSAPEKTYRALDGANLAALFAVNTIGPALIAKHLLPLLPRDVPAQFAVLSAKVGSLGDNRLGGWHSYRAAKAALNMLVVNFAVELRRSHPLAVIAALHPGTVDTPLSAPFQTGLREGQLQSPAASAAALLDVLAQLTPEDSGGLFAWDGARLPY